MTQPVDTPEPASGLPETAVEAPVEGAPSDNTTLVGVLATWSERGFSGQLVPREGGGIECVACGVVGDASHIDVVEWRRLEGASDPDDMVKALAAHCPHCGAGGTLVLGYGVNASEVDQQVSAALGSAAGGSVQVPE